ncbi:MAG: ABC transporter permease, partial [Euryarchaeota archaeon]|nr:ABC transporter permease [Euryarchaeota archaeon]
MGALLVARRELWEIVSNRKFMVAFALQTLLLLALLPAFSSAFSSGNLALPSPSMKGFAALGVVAEGEDCALLLEVLEENERLRLYFFSSPPEEELERGLIDAYLLIPREYQESSLRELQVVLFLGGGAKASVAEDAVLESVAAASSRLAAERRDRLGVSLESQVTLERVFLRPAVVERAGGQRFSSFFLAYLLPLVLFFPIFMSGGLVLDSVAGERERRTLEAMLCAPLSRRSLITGKFIALWGFVTAEVVVWLAGIGALGIPVARPWEALLLLAGVNALVVSLAMALALYSRSLKEANIALMLFYVPLFVGLIYSLSAEFFSPRDIFAYIPFNLISRAVSGE